MYRCMKTTVEIPDGLLDDVRRLAARERTTVRALIEEGLRKTLESRRREGDAFRLEVVTFRGDGLQPHVQEGGWEHLRDLAYEGRGA